MQPTKTKASLNSMSRPQPPSNPNYSRNTLKVSRGLMATTSSSYAYLHKKPKLKSDTFHTNRPSYMQTRVSQELYPQTYHTFDQEWKSGRKHIPEGNTLGAQIARLSGSMQHSRPDYKHSDLYIPNNRKKMNVRMENIKQRNPILEDPIDRIRSSSLENWRTERRQRDNGVYTRLTLLWKN